MNQQRKIFLENREVEYTLRKTRRARRLRVAVYCDATVVVSAPYGFNESLIESFLKNRAGQWIINKIEHFRKQGIRARVNLRGRRADYQKYKKAAYDLALEKVERLNKMYNFSYHRISIRNQKSRWGSCSAKRNLSFNYKIIFLTPVEADYLVVHELCHLKELNHSKRFWNLVAKTVPNYRKIARELKKRRV